MPRMPSETARSASDRLRESGLGTDLSFLLARANALSVAAGNAALAPFGLKVRSFSVLALSVGEVRPTQRDLSEFLRLDPSQVVALVDELEKRKLVERRPDPADRRANVVVATAEGRALHDRAASATKAAERSLHGELGEDDRRLLAGLLARVAYPGESR
ncbi:MarR family winged helix-turn-helix transcriptional regulator [Microbacterium sp. 4R-513]|uniref:MarR family winged helix-turn-helix transcriptional regulator n=1 Tax=Microbacterium sp. 4R-513 TaxID=2567934 RepID=UPI001F493542|nr:MarR family winged helix-turn-helix transcriptional regulator [Microbacterium sp. 4R-513]